VLLLSYSRLTILIMSTSISVTVRIPLALIEAAKEKLPCAGSTEIITTALKHWLKLDGQDKTTDSTEERFEAIEEQLRVITEQISEIDRSTKPSNIKASKPITNNQGLSFSQFNQEFGTSFRRGNKAAWINTELVRLGLADKYVFNSTINTFLKIDIST
jgi:hypothetical protein